ncbi:hypothetical protein GRX03_05465 [Halovenus sp. WSH3]|uniref:Origin-associated protein OapC n=1 Tax=Halovenus carboxidivorans TaxID=2692199 RepID=A0A6B0SZF5_9EURY|nr:Zn-ribbon containing protein [Halovenus carboxidivorans]MXR51054.1 hypothetical protein [Halovenus carboxidivorans]
MPHQCTDCGRQFDDGSKEMLSGCPDCGGTKFQFLPDGRADPEPTPEEPASIDEPSSSVARKVGSAATAVRDLVGGSGPGPSGGPDRPSGPDAPEVSGPDSAPDGSPPSPDTPSSDRDPSTAGSASSVPSDSDDRAGTTSDPLREPDPATMTTAESENEAQASARSEVISPDELPPAPERSGWAQTTPGPRTETEPESTPQSTTEPGSTRSEPTAEGPEPTQSETTAEQADRPDLSELRAELNQQFESIKVLEPGQYELNLMELFDREEYIIALQEDGKYTVQVPEHWQD